MENFELIETKRGQPLILYSGYRLVFSKKNKNGTTRWRCNDRKCSGSLVTNEEKKIVSEKQHTCNSNCAKNEVAKKLFVCKKRVREEHLPIGQIFEQTMMPLMDAGYEFVTDMPSLERVKSTLYRQRNIALGVTTFRCRSEIVLPNHLTDNFLFVDNGGEDRIFAFASEEARQLLVTTSDYFADGTFKSCCRNFDQLYTIHGDIGSNGDVTNIIPLIYAVLPDRSERTYIRLFDEIKLRLPFWQPKTFKVDYEIAAITAFRKSFPNSVVKGCNFHYNQSIWRRVQRLGLCTAYNEDSEIRRHIRMCAALSHLPRSAIDDGWLYIMEHAPQNDLLEEFNDYFVEQWLENSAMQDMWICYGERHRTTNAVEGWHNRLNRNIGKINPHIYELIKSLKEDSKFYAFQARQTEIGMTPRKRLKKYVNVDNLIHSAVSEFVRGNIHVGDCLSKLVYVIKF